MEFQSCRWYPPTNYPPSIRPVTARHQDQHAHELRPVSKTGTRPHLPDIWPCLDWIKIPKHPASATSWRSKAIQLFYLKYSLTKFTKLTYRGRNTRAASEKIFKMEMTVDMGPARLAQLRSSSSSSTRKSLSQN